MNCYEFMSMCGKSLTIVMTGLVEVYWVRGTYNKVQKLELNETFHYSAPQNPYTLSELCAYSTNTSLQETPWLIRGNNCRTFYQLKSNFGTRALVGDPDDPENPGIYMSFSFLGKGIAPWYNPMDPYAAAFMRQIQRGEAPANYVGGFFEWGASPSGSPYICDNILEWDWENGKEKESAMTLVFYDDTLDPPLYQTAYTTAKLTRSITFS